MSLGCLRARAQLVAAVGGHANSAEQLELETHLEGCARCRETHGALDVLRRVRGWEPPRLSQAARERVRAAALAADPLKAAPVHHARWVPIALGAALAAGLAFGVLWLNRAAAEDRVLGGDVVVAPAEGNSIPGEARLSAVRGGRVALGGTLVELNAATDARWDAASRTIDLTQGSVTVEVDPRQGKSFRVATPRFRVEVVGTRFTVDLKGVRTEHGVVRVIDVTGAPRALVGAGQSWSVPEPSGDGRGPSEAPPALAPQPPPVLPPAPPLPPARRPKAVAATDAAGAERLAQARKSLAKGDAAGARALLQGLPRAAEAGVLYAESFLVERRYADAIASYEDVIRTFDGTPQAETALYAIAQLRLETAGRDEAVRALDTYLERYPAGRFSHEAHERLVRLLGTR